MTTDDLSLVPLIGVNALSRALGCGEYAIETAAQRASIEFTRRPSGRREVSFAQATEIAMEIARKAETFGG